MDSSQWTDKKTKVDDIKKITTTGKHNHQYDDGVARNRAYVPGILSEVAARYKKNS